MEGQDRQHGRMARSDPDDGWGGGAMNEKPRRAWQIRSPAYLVLAIAAAFATPSPDVITMFWFFLAGVALFEAVFFAYRRWRGGGR
jgi:hypothetical protein